MSRQTLSDGNSLNSNSTWCGWDAEVGVNVEQRVDTTTITSTSAFGQRVNGTITSENIACDQDIINNLAAPYQIIPYTSILPYNNFTKTPRALLLTGTAGASAAIYLPFSNQTESDAALGFAKAADIGSEWYITNLTDRRIPVYTFDYTNYIPAATVSGPPTFAPGNIVCYLQAKSTSILAPATTQAPITYKFYLMSNNVATGKELALNWSFAISQDEKNYHEQSITSGESPLQIPVGAPHFWRIQSSTNGTRIVKLPNVEMLSARGRAYWIENYKTPRDIGLNQANILLQDFLGNAVYSIRPGEYIRVVNRTNTGATLPNWVVQVSGSLRKVISNYSGSFTPAFDDTSTYTDQTGEYSCDIIKHTTTNCEVSCTVRSRFTVDTYDPGSPPKSLVITLPLESANYTQTIMIDVFQGSLASRTFTHHNVPVEIPSSSLTGNVLMNFVGIDSNDDTWVMNFTYKTADYNS